MSKLCLVVLVLISGCATAPKDLQARVDTIDAPLKVQVAKAMPQIIQNAQAQGFRLQSADKDLGIITFAPKDYLLKRGMLGVAWPIRVNLQVTLAETRLRAIITYECQYGQLLNGNTQWAGCYSGDSELSSQADQIKTEISALLKT